VISVTRLTRPLCIPNVLNPDDNLDGTMRIVWNATHAVAIASRVPKPVNPNRVAGHSFETTYSWYVSARELLLPGLAPIRE
jgi:hypothetical protein